MHFLPFKTFISFISSDIDECVTGKNLCPYNRQCVNTFGSYFCKCQEGYDLKYVDGKYDCVGRLNQFSTGGWGVICDHFHSERYK